MDEKQKEILVARLTNIDRERAQLEAMLAGMPPDYRAAYDDELAALWKARLEIAEQLRPA